MGSPTSNGDSRPTTGLPLTLLLIERTPDGADDYLSVLLGRFNPSPVDWFHVRSVEEALEGLSKYTVDGVLLALTVSDTPVKEMISQIAAAAPKTPIVVLADDWDESLMKQAIRAGAQDYLLKGQIDGLLLERAFHMAVERKIVRV